MDSGRVTSDGMTPLPGSTSIGVSGTTVGQDVRLPETPDVGILISSQVHTGDRRFTLPSPGRDNSRMGYSRWAPDCMSRRTGLGSPLS